MTKKRNKTTCLGSLRIDREEDSRASRASATILQALDNIGSRLQKKNVRPACKEFRDVARLLHTQGPFPHPDAPSLSAVGGMKAVAGAASATRAAVMEVAFMMQTWQGKKRTDW